MAVAVFAPGFQGTFDTGITSNTVVEAQAATIKLNKKKATLIKGKTVKLKVKGTKKKVKWTSSNKKVATVTKKGLVKAKKKGKATITAKVAGKKLKCKITVETPKISATKTSIVIFKTKTIKMSGTTQTVKWSTSNSKVAAIKKNGKYGVKITAKKVGTATVTAKVGGKKYTCKVTVADTKKGQKMTKLKNFINQYGETATDGTKFIYFSTYYIDDNQNRTDYETQMWFEGDSLICSEYWTYSNGFVDSIIVEIQKYKSDVYAQYCYFDEAEKYKPEYLCAAFRDSSFEGMYYEGYIEFDFDPLDMSDEAMSDYDAYNSDANKLLFWAIKDSNELITQVFRTGVTMADLGFTGFLYYDA
ncbi:MAG: Ig-like domain-containing protein [Eubacterium sp.]|nr:Ig-like domain-containing protein [Eubacterium sp.]